MSKKEKNFDNIEDNFDIDLNDIDFDINDEFNNNESIDEDDEFIEVNKNEDNNEEKDKDEMIEQKKQKQQKIKSNKNDVQKILEELYEKYHYFRTEANQFRKEAGKYKKEIMHVLEEAGLDSTVINGPDDLIEIGIEIKEEEFIDKRNLAKEIGEGVRAKDLSNPQKIFEYLEKGILTKEMIERHTKINEQELFIDRAYNPEID